MMNQQLRKRKVVGDEDDLCGSQKTPRIGMG